ncbi:thioredoxin family protein [Abyssicoccus albus]|uniref:Thioredoxin n=1 Tax=Abyssicoccus albus TaxID=1817405 RepID=A0A3N5BPC6_9BACL|nr:thioredoxin family protein [Abyssicoccus albus]RPF58349.1 thioredoxin [Abyssicoccus albus]
MSNKIFYGIIGLIIVAFVGVVIFFQINQKSTDYYPYDGIAKEDLSGPSKDLLTDENYQDIIIPKDLENYKNGEGLVYFFSPTCSYCRAATPVLNKAIDNLDMEYKQFNLLEYQKFAQTYQIEATPTLIYFKDGKEVKRVSGNLGSVENFEKFLKEAKEEAKNA